jgi:hypothetical protein
MSWSSPFAPPGLQFFLTLGTIVLGAYVAVRVFGFGGSDGGGPGGFGGTGGRPAGDHHSSGALSQSASTGGRCFTNWRTAKHNATHILLPAAGPRCEQPRRRPDSRGRQSEFRGLLGSGKGEDGDLLDVWFERRPSDSGAGGGDRRAARRR